VIDEMRDKFIKKYDLNPENVIVISNYENTGFAKLSEQQIEDKEFTFKEDMSHMVYVGGIGVMRGLETVVHSVASLKVNGKNVRFLIIGNDTTQYAQVLKGLVRKLDLEKEVLFLGFKPFEIVNYYMQKATVNIIPHVKNGHTDYTIPHKLFQIFLSKSALLVSSCKPLKRIVEECNGGWVYTASDSEDLVKKYTEIERDPEEVQRRNQNAFDCAMNKYNWENEAQRLIQFYKGLNG
jgi:glycosyltransferase involved in cell wall biosynthesis